MPLLLNPDYYSFNVYSLPMLTVGAAIASLGFFILIRERGSRLGVTFFFMCLNIGIYQFCTGVNFMSLDSGLSLFWSKVGHLGVVFAPISILLFAAVRFGLSYRYRLAIWAIIALSIGIAFGMIFTDLYFREIRHFFWGNWAQFGPLGYAFMALFFCIMVFILHLYWREYRKSTTEVNRKRFGGLLMAFSVAYLGSVDFLPALGIPVYPFGYFPIFFFIIMSTYIVLRYSLVDITPELATREILDNMQGTVIVTDIEGKIVVANYSAQEMLGYQVGDLLGRDLASMVTIPVEATGVIGNRQRSSGHEVVWTSRDGRHFDVILSAAPLMVRHRSEPVGVVYVAHDITERKKAEETLRKSEITYRSIINSFSEAVYILNEKGTFLDVNKGAELMYGYTREGLIGKSPALVSAPGKNDLARVMEQCRLAYEGDAQELEFWGLARDGRIFPKEVHLYPGMYFGQKAIVAVARDITERKMAEEALRRSEDFIRSILDDVDQGFIVVDRDYKIILANKSFALQTGALMEDIIGKHCFGVSHHAMIPCYENGEDCAVKRVFETGDPCTAVHRHKGDKDSILVVETKAFPMKDPSGIITSVIETIQDVTARHLLEDERLKTDKLEAIGTLAGGIAHDFNNLLQGVFGYISLARLNVDKQEKCVAALEQAEKALHLSVHLTSQLLTFSKGGKPVKKQLDPRLVIENSVKFALSGSRSDYNLDVAGDLLHIEADEGQISQVIQNLILNADQAMPVGGRIEIRAKNVQIPGAGFPQGMRAGRYIEISISDEGIGIHEQHLARIFDPYFTTKEKGSGLGLATAYAIIRNHGGLISVKSTPGIGARFFIYLPAGIKGQTAERLNTAVTFASLRTGKILLMDDEQIIRDVGGELIRSMGHDVEFAVHGEEAIEKYRIAKQTGKPFDIVILDLTIRGGMGGADTMRKLLEIDPGVKAIVSSGYSDDSSLSEYGRQGFLASLKKPYTIEGLKTALNAVMK